MEDFVRIFRSPKGDIYHITLSEDNNILSSNAIDALKDVTLVGIDLRRLEGKHATGHDVLAAIERTIADFFLQSEDVIICYYCDFINPIPRTTKTRCPLRNTEAVCLKGCFRDTRNKTGSVMYDCLW